MKRFPVRNKSADHRRVRRTLNRTPKLNVQVKGFRGGIRL